VPRHYIETLLDKALPPALQQRCIDEVDEFVSNNRTRVHELNTSHSPFISRPRELAALLLGIAETEPARHLPDMAN
jgi:hypothetical protein